MADLKNAGGEDILANRDLAAGFLILGMGLLTLFVLIPYGVVDQKSVQFAAQSPRFYPRIVSIALIVLGLAVTGRAWLTGAPQSGAVSDQRPDAAFRIALVFGLLIAYAATVSWLGFILSSAIAMMVAFYLAGEKRLYLTIPMAVLIPVLLYFFFLKVARVPIPTGVLEPLLRGI